MVFLLGYHFVSISQEFIEQKHVNTSTHPLITIQIITYYAGKDGKSKKMEMTECPVPALTLPVWRGTAPRP